MLRAGRLGCGPWLIVAGLYAQPSAGQPEQKSTSQEAETITRPVPRGSLLVPFPEGEAQASSVVLEIVVKRDGSVREVRVIEGRAPFTTAASSAALKFHFDPARRGREPVPARIRLEIRFEPPALEPPSTTTDGDPAPGLEGSEPSLESPRPRNQPIEIVVLGDRAPPARSSLGRSEVRELPGAFGDPFRAVEVMPGVTPIFTGIPFFYVRGSPPGNVGYFLDGIRVPLLFHVALGPSVIHPGLVDRVDLYPGGYPARYGRFGGAIVAAETTPPALQFRGEGNVRIFDAGALAEAPFADGRGNALVGGRYSYTAAVLSLFAPEVTLSYWDYQARASYRLTPKWSVGAFAFGAYDLFRADDEDSSVGTQFHRLDLRADFTPDPGTNVRFATTFGIDSSAAQNPDGPSDQAEPTLRDKLISARIELDHQLARRVELRAGADLGLDRYEILDIGGEDDASEIFYTRDDVVAGIRGDLVWQPEPGVVITPGLRADVYVSGDHAAFALEPRIAAEFVLSRGVTLEHTFGVAQQAPSFIVPIPGFQLSDLKDGLQRSLQSSAGVVVRPGSGFQLGLTLFHNVFLSLTDFLGTLSLREQLLDEQEDERLDFRSLGQAYGVELAIKRALTQRLGGYFAYTLSRSTRSMGGTRTVANFDRTHVLHAALRYALGRNWQAGARLSAYTGVPAQRELRGVENGAIVAAFSPAHRRGPMFYRLDLRLEKRWPIARDGRYWAFVMEMLNSTLNREVPFYTCRADGCEGDAIGPVTIPSIGVEVFF